MKYLGDLADTLCAAESDECRPALRAMIEQYDRAVQKQVAEEHGEAVRRDRFLEQITSMMRLSVTSLVQAAADQNDVPDELRERLEAAFTEALEAARQRVEQR